MKNVVQDLTSGGIDWQREKWQSGLGSKFIHQGEKNAAKYADELMPGGSPTFKNEQSIEKLYKDLEALFAYASVKYEGSTLKEYFVRKKI